MDLDLFGGFVVILRGKIEMACMDDIAFKVR
jgi:hypothetical protein